ncbi:MAG: hypothetical protein KF894_23815 [Labilithrix sp.]|nr:hypothetical protein [Labilithrix sp.]
MSASEVNHGLDRLTACHLYNPHERRVIRRNFAEFLVWPAEGGAATVRGQMLTPLHRNVPLAAAEDPVLHELLALSDALRVGRARERELAREELKGRLSS